MLATADEEEYSQMLEERAMKCGADDFAWKPHTEYSLHKRVSRLMGLNVSRERQYQLESEAYMDYETGLYNRRGFDIATGQLRKEDLSLAVYVFELEENKKLRGQDKEKTEKQIPRRFSKILKQHTRNGDILARYEGEGFIVVLKRVQNDEIAVRKGEEICKAFYEELEEKDSVKCSVGIALCTEEEMISGKLIRREMKHWFMQRKMVAV